MDANDMKRFGTRRVVGGSVSTDELWIACGTDAKRFSIEPPDDERWSSLTEALKAARSECGTRTAPLRCAVLPPLCSMKSIPSRRLARREIERVIRDTPLHYFPWFDPEDVLVFTAEAGSPDVAIIGGASTRILDLIRRSCADARWRLDALVPAAPAWHLAAGNGNSAVAVATRSQTIMLTTNRRGITGIRRRLPHQLDSEVSDDGKPDVAVVAEAGRAAAEGAPLVSSSALMTSAAHTVRETSARRRVTTLLAATVCVTLLGDLAAHERARRTLGTVESERQAIRNDVMTQLEIRSRLDSLHAELDSLGPGRAHGLISGTLIEISRALSERVVLTRFEADEDTVTLEGSTNDLATALERIRSAEYDPVLLDAGNDGGPGEGAFFVIRAPAEGRTGGVR